VRAKCPARECADQVALALAFALERGRI